MKELRIYEVRTDSKSYLLRGVKVHPLFMGITEGGGVNLAEFRKLAEVLEPNLPKMRIEVIDL